MRLLARIAAATLLLFGAVAFLFARRDLPPGVHAGTVRRLASGMTREEVVAILGQPQLERVVHSQRVELPQGEGREPLVWDVAGGVRLGYGSQPWGAAAWPHVEVVLERGLLSAVYVFREAWWGRDDRTVYRLHEDMAIELEPLDRVLGAG